MCAPTVTVAELTALWVRRVTRGSVLCSSAAGTGEVRRQLIIEAIRDAGIRILWANGDFPVFGEKLNDLIRRSKVLSCLAWSPAE